MTTEQEQHLERVKVMFADRCDKKYRKGQREHGGDLHHIHIADLLNMAIDEAIDQVVYLLTMKEQLGV